MTNVAALFSMVGNAVAGTVRSFSGWVGDVAISCAAYVLALATKVGSKLSTRMAQWAQDAGWAIISTLPVRLNNQLRILPLGDSITAGFGSSDWNGYRQKLLDKLTGSFDVSYVGSRRQGTMKDNLNEGHSGWNLEAIGGLTVRAGQCHPNVVTFMGGTNDAVQDKVAGAAGRLEARVRELFAQDPRTSAVVSGLLPSTIPAENARDLAIGGAIPGIVDKLRGEGLSVVYADTSDITVSDLSDERHPNDGGYAKLAADFAKGIDSLAGKNLIQDPSGTPDPVTCAGGLQGGDPITPAGTATTSTADPSKVNHKARYADFDGDGKADYIVVDDLGAMTVWFNRGGDGAGGWEGPHKVAMGVAPGYQVQLADFDADGKADYIAVADDGSAKVWLNKGGDGGGGWDALGKVAMGTGPGRQVRFADMDADGRADYLVVSDWGAVGFWRNNGGDNRGGWGCGCPIAMGVAPLAQIQFADFDGDGKADYIVVDPDSSVKVWLNQGGDLAGGWKALEKVAMGVAPGKRIVFADVDGDARADYLVVEPSGYTQAWLNNGGDGRAKTGWVDQGALAYGVGAPGAHVQFPDIDGDGLADYAVVDPNSGAVDAWLNKGVPAPGALWLWAGQGRVAYGVPGFQKGDTISFGDLNGDHFDDYIDQRDLSDEGGTTPMSDKAQYYINGGAQAGNWKWTQENTKVMSQLLTPFTIGSQPLYKDLTGDGKADLIYLYPSGAAEGWLNYLSWPAYTGDGKGASIESLSWTQQGQIATGVGADRSRVRIADFDGDHKADYLITQADGSVDVYVNQSGGGKWTWSVPVRVAGRVSCADDPNQTHTAADTHTIQFADVTGDGRADFLCVAGNGAVHVWRNSDGKDASAGGWIGRGVIAMGVGT